MVGKAELSEGQKQLINPTISGTRKAEARRAEVEDRLLFRGGTDADSAGKQRTQNGSAALAGTVNQPLKSGSRGTRVNITA